MTRRISDSILERANTHGDDAALRFDGRTRRYADLAGDVERCARGLLELGLAGGDRVGIYLEKRFETVVGLFGAAAAGGAFVPLNPLLKPRQVRYILADCGVRVLVTSSMRLAALADALSGCADLGTVVLVDGESAAPDLGGVEILSWDALMRAGAASSRQPHPVSDSDLAAILYTSGSTGLPKGVMLSHRNLTVGAESVASYLENHPEDRILSVLPLSFDAGLSQLTTSFHAGASVVLMNYLLPRDVVRVCASERVTGLTCVPPLWIQLAQLDWPAEAAASLRYFANTGGHMPRATLDKLRAALPGAKPYLMYGLTEAFRSTYLDPAEIDRRPDSMGKAIPNAEILVVDENGQMCGPGETGELVHCGPLVAMGYWNDAERTAERFRPAPDRPGGGAVGETAVWSGDSVRLDDGGFLYFVARRDEMIKTSGYRVSPTEVEEVVYATNAVGEAVALGAPDAALGQAIVVVATPPAGGILEQQVILDSCRRELPAYMVPRRIVERDTLPYNANGKIDRKRLAAELSGLFEEAAT
ncbi:MAG: acyl-CoA ligase (AMP-forming), exosortase A system-associated [Alphaproteobacteria bacterium]